MGIEKSRLRQTNKPNVKHREIMTAEESKELSEWKPQHIKANPSHPNSPKSREGGGFLLSAPLWTSRDSKTQFLLTNKEAQMGHERRTLTLGQSSFSTT